MRTKTIPMIKDMYRPLNIESVFFKIFILPCLIRIDSDYTFATATNKVGPYSQYESVVMKAQNFLDWRV